MLRTPWLMVSSMVALAISSPLVGACGDDADTTVDSSTTSGGGTSDGGGGPGGAGSGAIGAAGGGGAGGTGAGGGTPVCDVTFVEHAMGLFGLQRAAPADVDGDGDVDLFANNRDGEDLYWFENVSGDGATWERHAISFPVDNVDAVDSIVAADVDGDGNMDVLFSGSKIAWFENDAGDGSSWTQRVVDGSAAPPVSAGDINGDGDLDIVAGTTWWRNNDGNGTDWSELGPYFPGVEESVVVDFDGNGTMDVVGANGSGDMVVLWSNGDGTGTASAWSGDVLGMDFRGVNVIATGDLDGDSDLDVAAGAFHAVGNWDESLSWFESPTGTEHVLEDAANIASTKSVHNVEIVDMDRDGRLDVLAVLAEQNTAYWWRNDGGQWSRHTIGTGDGLFNFPRRAFAADVDGDGDLDVVGGHTSAASDAFWWENQCVNAP